MAYCVGCKRPNCSMTNNGECPFYTYTSIDYGDTIYDGRNRRQRRADERAERKQQKRKFSKK